MKPPRDEPERPDGRERTRPVLATDLRTDSAPSLSSREVAVLSVNFGAARFRYSSNLKGHEAMYSEKWQQFVEGPNVALTTLGSGRYGGWAQ